MRVTREQVVDVAVEVLGRRPDAGMAEVAAAAGVVRRTLYGHFPSRADLVQAITQRAVAEIAAVLAEVDAADQEPGQQADPAADVAWARFMARLWPLAHRYRVLVELRRGEHGPDIHARLGPVEDALTALVRRGQDSGTFGRHLPPDVLGQVAWSATFTLADQDLAGGRLSTGQVVRTTLLLLGVPGARAQVLADRHGEPA